MLATLFPNNVRHGGHRFVGTCLQTERKKKKVKGNWRTNLKLRKNIIITGTETAKKNVQLDCSLIPFNYFVLNRTGLVNLRARRTLSYTKQKFRHNNNPFGVGICAQQLWISSS
jgi:hypothetical protein